MKTYSIGSRRKTNGRRKPAQHVISESCTIYKYLTDYCSYCAHVILVPVKVIFLMFSGNSLTAQSFKQPVDLLAKNQHQL
jgi:hypothetical protein